MPVIKCLSVTIFVVRSVAIVLLLLTIEGLFHSLISFFLFFSKKKTPKKNVIILHNPEDSTEPVAFVVHTYHTS